MRLIVAVALLLSYAPTSTRGSETHTATAANAITFDEVLSWLPEDTETVTVAHGPFPIPNLRPSTDQEDHELSNNELTAMFDDLAIGLIGIKDGVLQKSLVGKRVYLAIEGARHFQPPSALGGSLFEGCQIIVFAPGFEVDANAFMEHAGTNAKKLETLEHQKIAVFGERLESDDWTFWVTVPKPNLVIVATNEGYLREVLRRIDGGNGKRALPATLPEWKYVDTDAPVWALRHFDANQPQENFTSPFYDDNLGPVIDRQLIGEVLRFDLPKSRTARVIFVSSDEAIFSRLQTSALMHSTEPAAPSLHIKGERIAPGVVSISYDLERSEAAALFFFIVPATLGHAVFL